MTNDEQKHERCDYPAVCPHKCIGALHPNPSRITSGARARRTPQRSMTGPITWELRVFRCRCMLPPGGPAHDTRWRTLARPTTDDAWDRLRARPSRSILQPHLLPGTLRRHSRDGVLISSSAWINSSLRRPRNALPLWFSLIPGVSILHRRELWSVPFAS